MSRRSPVITIAGKLPAVGRTAVRHDYEQGKLAAANGDPEKCRRLAANLGRFAMQHVPLAVVSAGAAVLHATNAVLDRGTGSTLEGVQAVYDGLYTSVQYAVIRAQLMLSGKLYKKADGVSWEAGIDTPPDREAPTEQGEHSLTVLASPSPSPEVPAPPPWDKRITYSAHALWAGTIASALTTEVIALSQDFSQLPPQ